MLPQIALHTPPFNVKSRAALLLYFFSHGAAQDCLRSCTGQVVYTAPVITALPLQRVAAATLITLMQADDCCSFG